MKSKLTERVTVRVSGELGDAIREIQSHTHAANPTEVVRRALLVYHTLVAEKAKGNEPAIINRVDDGPEFLPLFL